jgi:hypothetical protein
MMRNFFWIVLLSAAAVSSVWADSRYVIRGGEVYDQQTKLTWSRCSVGQEWKNEHCSGAIKEFTFEDAQKQAGGGWRVPTKDELASLIDADRKKFPTTDVTAFPDMDASHPWYWSSTPNGTSIAWYVDFADGYTSGYINDSNVFALRMVRSDQ